MDSLQTDIENIVNKKLKEFKKQILIAIIDSKQTRIRKKTQAISAIVRITKYEI